MTAAVRGAVLRHPKLTHAELCKFLVERIPNTQSAWYIVSRAADTEFSKLDKSGAETLVSEWTQGRVFCEDCEVRWKRPPDSDWNDVVFLWEDPGVQIDGFQRIGTEWLVVSPGERAMLVAWGRPDPEAPHLRTETRLPKRLRYPEECREGRLVCLYYCTPSLEVQFVRLKGVK